MTLLSISQQIILSGIIILVAIFNFRHAFPKRAHRLIQKDIEAWKGTFENLIKYKNYEYDKAFWLVIFENSFLIFIISIELALRDWISIIIGFYPWLISLLCAVFMLLHFATRIVPSALENSKQSMKILYECNR